MAGFWTRGLTIDMPAPPPGATPQQIITEEAALSAEIADDLRVEPRVAEGDTVAQGAPLFHLRRQPGIAICAPMPGRVARLDLAPGQRLRGITLFHEPGEGRHCHTAAQGADTPDALRAALQGAGLWTAFRSRPFGRHPAPDEVPAAIFVMAADTRPAAADPRLALQGQEEAFARGIAGLGMLGDGPLHLCQTGGLSISPGLALGPRGEVIEVPALHPHGLPGLQIHRHFPATPARPVWDIAAEDVAAIGTLLGTGHLPETRLVALGGTSLREGLLVRCQPWADLRSLSRGHVRPGPHRHLSGSAIDGREARWLRPNDRQVSVMAPQARADDHHWFLSALRGARRPLPLIPSAAVDQALGGAIPAMPLLRALASGDGDAAIRLGVLSLLPEDLALADYVTCAQPRLSHQLAGLLARIEREEVA